MKIISKAIGFGLALILASCSASNQESIPYTYISGIDGEGNHRVEYTEIEGKAIFEGDIILGSIAEVEEFKTIVEDSESILGNQIVGKRYLWPDGIVPYTVSNSVNSTGKRNLSQAIEIIHRETNVRLIPKTQISRYSGNSITFQAGTDAGSCSSFVGMRGGSQPINLGVGSCSVESTIHEIAHALGIWHEQSRSDRDNFVRIVWDNIPKNRQHNFKKRTYDGKPFGAYDCQSIMHYSRYAFAIDRSKPTIIPKNANCTITRNGLTRTDINAINSLYPLEKVSGGLVTKIRAWGDANQCGGRKGDVVFSPFGRFGRKIVIDTDERGGGCIYGFGVVDTQNRLGGDLGMRLKFSGPSNQCSGTGSNIVVPTSDSFEDIKFSKDIVVDTDDDGGGCLLTISISDPSASIDLQYPDNNQCSICTSSTGKCRDANKSSATVTATRPIRLWIDADDRSGGCSLRLRPNSG